MSALALRRSTALTISPDRHFYLSLLKDEGNRRARATVDVCGIAAMAYEEGARLAIERMLRPSLGFYAASKAADRLAPTYTEIRNFLIGELDAHEVIACRVAAARTATWNKYRHTDDERYVIGGERGWL